MKSTKANKVAKTKNKSSGDGDDVVSGAGERAVRWVVGMGFWVQGFRCFAWMGVNYYLKDGLGVAPAALQILVNSSNLPMVAKPIYGLVSDAVYLGGEHRLPYVAIGAILQAISWIAIAILPATYVSVAILTVFLLLSNLGASIVEVANDAIVVEASKQYKALSGQLQSFAWMSASSAGVLGNLLGGIAVNYLSPRTMFLLFAIVLVLQFFTVTAIKESFLNLPKRKDNTSKSSSIRKQMSELSFTLSMPAICHSIAWFSASYAVIPLLTGTMFFYQTEHLHLDSSVIGFSKVFGQAALLIWSLVYNKQFKKTPARKVLSALQATIAVFMASDVLFVKGFYKNMGVPDSLYVIIFSGLLETLFQFKVLPFSVLLAQLCPAGCEGSVMAFFMSAAALSAIISSYLGVALAAYLGISGTDFSGLTVGLMIQAVCTVLPVFGSSWIPVIDYTAKKKE